MPMVLAQKLKFRFPHLSYLLFLDNLFLNVDVAHALLNIGISVMGTTRKNATGLPEELLRLKDAKQAFLYGGLVAIVQGKTLCFAWQDNNVVLGLTTAFSLHQPRDIVIRNRKRPKDSLTNAAIAVPIFGGLWNKDLPIPTAIDAYNHGMNAVDVANQLRANFTCHLAFEQRNWRPLAFWLFDVCCVNSFVIWRTLQPEKAHRRRHLHNEFERILIDDLLARGPNHRAQKLTKRRRCAWGARHPEDCWQGDVESHRKQKGERSRRRQALQPIINGSRPKRRSRNVITGCLSCGVNLCVARGCFRRYHAHLHTNLLWNRI